MNGFLKDAPKKRQLLEKELELLQASENVNATGTKRATIKDKLAVAAMTLVANGFREGIWLGMEALGEKFAAALPKKTTDSGVQMEFDCCLAVCEVYKFT